MGTLALSNKMKCPSQTGAHHAAKLAGTLALAGTRAGKPSNACRTLFCGSPCPLPLTLPDPKGFFNYGFMGEYNQPSGLKQATDERHSNQNSQPTL